MWKSNFLMFQCFFGKLFGDNIIHWIAAIDLDETLKEQTNNIHLKTLKSFVDR